MKWILTKINVRTKTFFVFCILWFTVTDALALDATLYILVEEGGQVSSSDGSVECGETDIMCVVVFNQLTTVTLTATARSGYAWNGWDFVPGCDAQSSCTFTIDPEANPYPIVYAMFTATGGGSAVVEVSVVGEGTITDSTGDFNCSESGGSCTAYYATATELQFNATPAPGFQFVGWINTDCGTSQDCLVSVDPQQTPSSTIRAEFEPETVPPPQIINEAKYTYNTFGQRTSKIVNGETTFFAYATDGALIAEFDEQGNTIREYYRNNSETVAFSQKPGQVGVQTLFVHNDHLATPEFVTDDQAGIVWRAKRMPFGETTVDEDPDGDSNLVSLPLRFPGQYYDEETGLHYNYFRDYDPTTGRYLQSDPIGLDGGLNVYTYALANPVNWIDFDGQAPKPGLGSGVEAHNGGKEHVHWGPKSNPRQNAVNKDGTIRHGKEPTSKIKKLINSTFGWNLKLLEMFCPLCTIQENVPTPPWDDPNWPPGC